MAFETTKKIRFVASVDGADKVRQGFAGISSGLLDTQRAVGLARTAFAGLIGIAGASAFVGIVNGAIDAKAKLFDLSLQTGIAVERLGGLSKVAQFSNTSLDEIASASAKLNKVLHTTSDESKGAGLALTKLGINVSAFKQLGADEQLLAVANAMAQFEDGTDKTAAAMLLFGKTGATLLPFLNELAERGLVASNQTTESAAAAKQYQDNLVSLRGAGEGWTNTLATQMLPALVAITDEFVKVKGEAGDVNIVISALKVTFETLAVLGANVAFVFGGLGRELGAIAAQGAALVRGDFAGIGAIRDAVIEDGKQARAALDALELKLLGIAAAKARVSSAGEFQRGDKDTTRVARPRLGDLSGGAADAAKKAADTAIKIAQQAANARSALRQSEEAAIIAFERGEDQRRNKEVQAAREAVQAAQFEYDSQGLLRSQIASVALQRLHDKQTAFVAGSENFDAVQREIEAQRELINVLHRGEARDERRRNDPTEGANRAIKAYLEDIKAAGLAAERVVGGAIQSLEDGLTGLFTKGRFDARSFIDALISEFIRLRVVKPLIADLFTSLSGSSGGILGILGAVLGFRAAGGPVQSGAPYVVGERGPEIFVPQSAGTVLPNTSMGGRSVTFAPVTHIRIDSRSDRAQVAQLVGQAVAQGNQQFAAQLRAQGVF